VLFRDLRVSHTLFFTNFFSPLPLDQNHHLGVFLFSIKRRSSFSPLIRTWTHLRPLLFKIFFFKLFPQVFLPVACPLPNGCHLGTVRTSAPLFLLIFSFIEVPFPSISSSPTPAPPPPHTPPYLHTPHPHPRHSFLRPPPTPTPPARRPASRHKQWKGKFRHHMRLDLQAGVTVFFPPFFLDFSPFTEFSIEFCRIPLVDIPWIAGLPSPVLQRGILSFLPLYFLRLFLSSPPSFLFLYAMNPQTLRQHLWGSLPDLLSFFFYTSCGGVKI